MGDDGGSLRGGGLAEHHKLDPLGDTVEECDESLQDGVIHCAAMHHKAVVVLKLQAGKGVDTFLSHLLKMKSSTYLHTCVLISPQNWCVYFELTDLTDFTAVKSVAPSFYH